MLQKEPALVCDRYVKEIELRICKDREKGATQLYLESLEILKKWLDHERKDEQCFKRLLARIVRGQPSMAPMLNLANNLLLAMDEGWEAVEKSIKKTIEKTKVALKTLAGNAKKELLRYTRFITTSYSSTTKLVFTEMSRERDFVLLIPKGDPFPYGLKLARELAEEGVKVELTFDALAPYLVKDVDAVVVGADAVEERGVVNGAGTFSLALAANHYGVPLYVVCTTDKFLPPLLSRYHVIKDEKVEVEGAEDMRIIHRIFDATPIELVTAFITEEGTLNLEGYKKYIQQKKVSPIFHSLLEIVV